MTTRLALALCAPAVLLPQTGPGLIATYTGGARTLREVTPSPNFFLAPHESIHPALAPVFQAEWNGILTILQNGDYEFDPEVSMNGKSGRQFPLTAGAHKLTIRSAEARSLRLRWRSTSFDWEPVPRAALSHNISEAPDTSPWQGRLLVRKLGCANCHGGAAPQSALDGIGSRTTAAWLHGFLGTHTIPLEPARRADAAAFLASLKLPADPKFKKPAEVEIGRGGELFGTIGCQACHQLTGLGSKYSHPALTHFLLERHRPSMLLNEQEAGALAGHLVRSINPVAAKTAPPGDPERGKAVIEIAGCLGCHRINGLTSTARRAPPLSNVRGAACSVTRYDIDENQWRQIRMFLAGPQDRSPAPVFELRIHLIEHGCLNCHKAGAEAPSLDGIGEKLRTAWIGEVLWGKKRVRTGRELRMPHYDRERMEPWITSFAKAEGVEPGDGPSPPDFTGIRQTSGLGRIGTDPKEKGMGCIGCHDWGENKSLGEEGPQLVNGTERMRFDWYERWMRNPARILSGTSMPNYFGSMPRDRAMPLIHELWAGMELGPLGKVPEGYRASQPDAEAKPVPGNEPIVIRWDMPGATPAAIAVGLPGGLSYCFDAGRVQLLYSWRGGFLDMTGTLFRKVDKEKLTPTAAIIGDITYKADGFPFRVGTREHVPKARFRGYKLIAGFPEFHYTIDGIEVHESLTPAPGNQAIRRTLRFSPHSQPIWFEGREISPEVSHAEVVIGQ
jgi:mono/diheme cytochrome c family protein